MTTVRVSVLSLTPCIVGQCSKQEMGIVASSFDGYGFSERGWPISVPLMYASSGVEMCRVSEGSVGGGRVCVSGVWADRVGGCSYRCAVEIWVHGWVWVGVSHRTTNNTKVIGAQAWPSSLIALYTLQTSIIFTVYSFGTVVCHAFTVHETLLTHSTYHTHTHVFGTNGKLCFNMRNANYRSPSVHDSSPLIYSSELL